MMVVVLLTYENENCFRDLTTFTMVVWRSMWRSNPWLFVDHVTDAPKSETDQLNQDKLQGRGCKVPSVKEFVKVGQLIAVCHLWSKNLTKFQFKAEDLKESILKLLEFVLFFAFS